MAGFDDAGAKPLPHFVGHRERLKERFSNGGPDAIPDYELLEMVLFRAIRRGDTKALAKQLLARFGTFAEVMSAEPERLMEVKGVGEAVGSDRLQGEGVIQEVKGKGQQALGDAKQAAKDAVNKAAAAANKNL